MFTTTRTSRVGWAGVAVGALLLGAGALAAPASADVNPATVDPAQTATLIVHKHETSANAGTPADGLLKTPTSEPIDGVTFKVERIDGVDLSTNAGWLAASSMIVGQALLAAKTTTETGVTGEAEDDGPGIVTFAGLPLGLYLVTETAQPDGVVPSQPFLVTLPLTDPDEASSWLYTVHVYPKNEKLGVRKAVDDSTASGLGDTVGWWLRADVPDEQVTSYQVTDTLDTRLTYTGASVFIGANGWHLVEILEGTTGSGYDATYPATAQPGDAGYDPYRLVAGVDYALTSPTGAGGTVTVEFLQPGLDKLEAAKADLDAWVGKGNTVPADADADDTAASEVGHLHVRLTLATKVTDVGDGTITNTGTLLTNGGTVTSNTVKTVWGGARFLKTADKDNLDTALNEADHLEGAVFEIYTDAAHANKVTVDGKSRWTSGQDGSFTVDGLRAKNQDGSDVTYYLVEVTAPEGYELLAQAVPFTVAPGPASETGWTAVIVNVEKNAGFTLPLTGGSGTALLTLGGLLVLASAGVLVFRSRRQPQR